MTDAAKITGIIPTFNEEIHIQAAIDSLAFADEILVIDSFSTDDTVTLAKERGVRVIQRTFDDFSSQKNHAIGLATHPWIFLLDADERVPASLRSEVLHIIQQTDSCAAYWIARANFFMKRRIKYSGWQNDKVMRLFKRDECQYNGRLVHERLVTSGEVGRVTNALDHHTYKNFNSYMGKQIQYAQLQAKELARRGVKAHFGHFMFKPGYRFFKHYILGRGFLDGSEGFFIAVISAYGVFIRYLNLWLINRGQK